MVCVSPPPPSPQSNTHSFAYRDHNLLTLREGKDILNVLMLFQISTTFRTEHCRMPSVVSSPVVRSVDILVFHHELYSVRSGNIV